MQPNRILAISFLIVAVTATAARSSTFVDMRGFEDDVDLVVSTGRQFLVVPEEGEDGSGARLTIIDLDPATGAFLGVAERIDVLGFENGVDPMVIRPVGSTFPVVVVPTESENGESAEILVLKVNSSGTIVGEVTIVLGDLGFRDDVDGTWTGYIGVDEAVAFFPLETEDGTERGLITIDVFIGAADPDFGSCSLLSTDGRGACVGGENIEVDWLPGLADGVDPVSYPTAASSRLILPVASAAGNDLLIVDYDPNDAIGPSPLYLTYTSVKAANAAGLKPTPFPGFERDVDIRVFVDDCTGEDQVLVPVEGPGDICDLYMINFDGTADWVLSLDGVPGGATIPAGYEAGVDLVPMCIAAGVNPRRVAVPLETADGSDADLWIVNLDDGDLIARAEDPTINPGLTIPGFEIGVDPMLYASGQLLVPVEDPSGIGGVLVLNQDAVLLDADFYTTEGFVRSVDPIVAPLAGGNAIYVPVSTPDGTNSDITLYSSPPALDGVSVEALNPGLTFGRFEWDVDLGMVNKADTGSAWLYLPEEDPTGFPARLRFELVPAPGPHLAVAAQAEGATPSTLHFFDAATGTLAEEFANVLGLETGLDMATSRGPARLANPPGPGVPPGQDADTDPTLAWAAGPTGVGSADVGVESSLFAVGHRNPFVPPGQVWFSLTAPSDVRFEILDVTGRKVRGFANAHWQAGEHAIGWDGRDERGAEVASGVYFVRARAGRAQTVSKLLVVR
jgi:FlgD Ig-like domain